MSGEKEGAGEAVFSRCIGGRVRRRAVLAVDGRIVIVALYQFHVVGVRAGFATGYTGMWLGHEACRGDHGFLRSCSRFEAREEAGRSSGFAALEILSV